MGELAVSDQIGDELVAIGPDAVRVRHSLDQSGPVLAFTHGEWRAFLTGARAGEFDLPASS